MIQLFPKDDNFDSEALLSLFPEYKDLDLQNNPPVTMFSRKPNIFAGKGNRHKYTFNKAESAVSLVMSDFDYTYGANDDHIVVDLCDITSVTLENFVLDQLVGLNRPARSEVKKKIDDLVVLHYRLNQLLTRYSEVIAPRHIDEVSEVLPFVRMYLRDIVNSFSDFHNIQSVDKCNSPTDLLSTKIDVCIKGLPCRCRLSGIPDVAIRRDHSVSYGEVKVPVFPTAKCRVSHNTLGASAKSQLIGQTIAMQKDDAQYIPGFLTDFTTCNICILERKIDEEGLPIEVIGAVDGKKQPVGRGHHILMSKRARNNSDVVLHLIMILLIDPAKVYSFMAGFVKHPNRSELTSFDTPSDRHSGELATRLLQGNAGAASSTGGVGVIGDGRDSSKMGVGDFSSKRSYLTSNLYDSDLSDVDSSVEQVDVSALTELDEPPCAYDEEKDVENDEDVDYTSDNEFFYRDYDPCPGVNCATECC